ncbi:MAG: hypothetical protein ACR2KL_00435 [Nocardioidaceae bacterium]
MGGISAHEGFGFLAESPMRAGLAGAVWFCLTGCSKEGVFSSSQLDNRISQQAVANTMLIDEQPLQESIIELASRRVRGHAVQLARI